MSDCRLHIVTVLYRSDREFSALWSDLCAQTLGAFRIIVVDNSATPGSTSALRALTDARATIVPNADNLGFAKAVNQGLRIALGEGATRCLLLNPDTSLAPDFLEELVASWAAQEWPVVAPRVMQMEDPARSWYAGGSFDDGWTFANRHDEYHPGDPDTPRVVEFASGCCLGLSRKVLDDVGLLDESFFVYWEDADYCLRLKAAGIAIHYLPHPMLLHQGGASSGGERSPAATRLLFVSYMLLLRKHFGMAVALRTMFRTLRRERARPGARPGFLLRIGTAMLRGLAAPLRPEPRLDG
jgi:GT2 family glycosyltransferase